MKKRKFGFKAIILAFLAAVGAIIAYWLTGKIKRKKKQPEEDQKNESDP